MVNQNIRRTIRNEVRRHRVRGVKCVGPTPTQPTQQTDLTRCADSVLKGIALLTFAAVLGKQVFQAGHVLARLQHIVPFWLAVVMLSALALAALLLFTLATTMLMQAVVELERWFRGPGGAKLPKGVEFMFGFGFAFVIALALLSLLEILATSALP